MRVLVYEGATGGHVLNYLRLLVPELVKLADDVHVVVRHDAPETDEFRCQLGHLRESVHWDASAPTLPKSLMRGAIASSSDFLAAVRRCQPDHIYVPSGDLLSPLLGLGRVTRWSQLPAGTEAEIAYHHGGIAYPAPSFWKYLQYRMTVQANKWAPWSHLHFVDLLTYQWLIRHRARLSVRCSLLPDPAESPPDIGHVESRRRLSLPEDGRLVGCVGAIDERKGIHFLLPAFARAKLREDDRLLLVGRHSERIRSMLAGDFAELVRQGRIISADRYVSVEELLTALSALNLVCTPHNRHIGISSVVIRAAASQRPVLATEFGWSGLIVPQFDLGWTCHVQDVEQFAGAIRTQLEASSEWCLKEAGRRFVAFNSTENFVASWTKRIRERLEMPPAENTVSWDNVLEAVRGTDELARQIAESLNRPWSEADSQRVRHYAETHSIENYQRISSSLVRERIGELDKQPSDVSQAPPRRVEKTYTIVWLVTGKETYGIRQAVLQLTQGVRKRGWRLAIVCIQEGEFADKCREMGFETQVLDVGHPPDFHGIMSAKPSELFRMWKYSRRAAPKLTSLLQEVSADAVHFLWPNLVSVAGRAAAQCGIPAFWEMPNYVSSRYWFGWNRWLYQSACWRYGVAPLANSASTAASLGYWPVRPTVCYLGVDSHRFNPANVRSLTRDELGIPQDAIVFGITARLTREKGQQRFLRAMLRVGQHDPPLHLLLLGGPIDDQYAQSIRAIAAEAGAADRLHLTGAVNTPERYYEIIDVAVNSRIDAEPFGLSVIEAMMMKRPVLVHALGGPAETVIDGKTGWHVMSPDVEFFAQGIRRALGDRPRWTEMGRQARQHALEHLSIEQQVENYMSIVQRILTERCER